MYKLCIVLIFASALLGSCSAFKITSRIRNGLNSSEQQFKFYAYLEIETDDGTKTCGGSLIDNQWVLTAAHCLHGAVELAVQLGTYEIRNFKEKGRITLIAEDTDVFIHPSYHKRYSWNDVGLVKLPKPVEFNEFVEPISLPKSCESNEYKDAVVMGHGQISGNNNNLPQVLQYIPMKTLSSYECEELFPMMTIGDNSVICAIGERGGSICTGDSGSPLVSNNVVIGVSSFIHHSNCDFGLPQGFADVVSYLKWIKEITGLDLPSC